jgi:hypothetical protein
MANVGLLPFSLENFGRRIADDSAGFVENFSRVDILIVSERVASGQSAQLYPCSDSAS